MEMLGKEMSQLKLDSYSGKTIQEVFAILNNFLVVKSDMKISEALIVLNKEIQKIHQKHIERSQEPSNITYREKVVKALCPSCEKGYLWPVKNYEGLNIVACRKCRYSFIIEEKKNG